MQQAIFDMILERRQAAARKVLASKGEEYSTDRDRLHNFKRAAIITGTTVPKAWLGMWLKHLVSLLDMIESEETPSQDWVDEKIGDLINYLHLLEGIYADRRKDT